MSSNNNSFRRFLGVGVTPKDAQKTRLLLYKENILIKERKIIKSGDLIFFPILNSNRISKILSDIPFKLEYQDFPGRFKRQSLREIVKKNFPNEDWDNISLKYDQIGDIAVLKLDPKKTSIQLRQRVAKEIISQQPKIHSVLNKINTIEGEERVYPIEFLTEPHITQTWHREYGIWLFVDLLRAYFNPRLAEEHHRIANSINSDELILDLFTGVGSFPLHCAKRYNCKIIAIDINKYAIYALLKSINRNRLCGTIYPIIGDSYNILKKKKYFDRVIINLPEKSLNYLPYATCLIKKGGIISFFQFIPKTKDPAVLIRNLIAKQVGDTNSYKELYIKVGREVSPSKIQCNVDLIFI